MEYKRLLLVFNPVSGAQEFADNLYAVIRAFTVAGYEVTAYPTQRAGDAKQFIMRRAETYDLLVCSGGDGTLNETVDALMMLDHKPKLGYIPAGTTNDFAHSLHLPVDDILKAVNVIIDGESRMLDIGRFGGNFFSYIAAFGLFTDVSYATPQSTKNILGHMAYLLEGAKRLSSIRSYNCTVALDDGEILTGDFIFGMVTNSLSVGGFRLPYARNTTIQMDDGRFEITLLRMPTSFSDLQRVVVALLNRETHSDLLVFRQACSLTVTSEQPLAWTLDGEFGGELKEARITNCCAAIEIMMPPQPKALPRP